MVCKGSWKDVRNHLGRTTCWAMIWPGSGTTVRIFSTKRTYFIERGSLEPEGLTLYATGYRVKDCLPQPDTKPGGPSVQALDLPRGGGDAVGEGLLNREQSTPTARPTTAGWPPRFSCVAQGRGSSLRRLSRRASSTPICVFILIFHFFFQIVQKPNRRKTLVISAKFSNILMYTTMFIIKIDVSANDGRGKTWWRLVKIFVISNILVFVVLCKIKFGTDTSLPWYHICHEPRLVRAKCKSGT